MHFLHDRSVKTEAAGPSSSLGPPVICNASAFKESTREIVTHSRPQACGQLPFSFPKETLPLKLSPLSFLPAWPHPVSQPTPRSHLAAPIQPSVRVPLCFVASLRSSEPQSPSVHSLQRSFSALNTWVPVTWMLLSQGAAVRPRVGCHLWSPRMVS